MFRSTERAAGIRGWKRLGVAALSALPLASVFAAPGSASAAAGQLALTGNVLPGLSQATKVGPVPASTPMRVLVDLQRPDPAGESAAYAAMYNPASPQYHHFLTPSQFTARFGVPSSQTQELSSWLGGGGLHVFYTAPAGDVVEASGNAAQVSALFHTTISSYTFKGLHFIANEQRPSVPANLPVVSVVGLNTLQHFTTNAPQPSTVPNASTPCNLAGPALNPPLPSSVCVGDYTPQDMWKLYDMPSSDEGQGQSMGIFMEGITASVIADLRVFEARMGLPRVPVTVVPAPQPSQEWVPTDNSGEFEWDLDSDSSTGAAPLADRLYYYDANSLYDADVEAEFSTWANDPNGPLQMNASFGECETIPANAITGNPAVDPPGIFGLPYGEGLGDNLEPVAEGTLMHAAMEGRTLFSSAGDTGGSCPGLVVPILGAGNGVANQGDPYQNYPCASRYVVCVGGTVLYANDDTNGFPQSRYTEISWTHTGGGNSGFISEPDFQLNYLPAGGPTGENLAPCVTDYTGTTKYAVGT
ncbi:MAG: hypothetical protein JOY68_06095, partial [Candidatus Dormibacteraeota bacterium]|nr:hypothetical protein [Candidatus Dormibacteraeota bacterium]